MQTGSWTASPILGVRRVREAAEYYVSVLGFDLDPEFGVFQPEADDPQGVYAIVKREGVWLHLQIRRGEEPVRVRESIECDVYIYVPDVESLHAEFQERGANILRPPADQAYGLRDMVVEDLNGYRLVFGQFLS
ncbi:MAG: VOC family protein [Fimbriimonadaceae bacterium]|nr:VOC family protein [Fimbriimonadaceae bacterium]